MSDVDVSREAVERRIAWHEQEAAEWRASYGKENSVAKRHDADAATLRALRAALGRCEEAEAERDALRRDLNFYKEREKHFATALKVCDGGRYRNDWDAAIREVLAERDALRAERDQWIANSRENKLIAEANLREVTTARREGAEAMRQENAALRKLLVDLGAGIPAAAIPRTLSMPEQEADHG